jgi:hypothetical protein
VEAGCQQSSALIIIGLIDAAVPRFGQRNLGDSLPNEFEIKKRRIPHESEQATIKESRAEATRRSDNSGGLVANMSTIPSTFFLKRAEGVQ